MSIYYITIFVFLLLGNKYDKNNNLYLNKNNSLLVFSSIFILTLVFGFRYEVGVDWFNYIDAYFRHTDDGMLYKLTTLELGYKALNIIAYYFNQGIVTVIVISTFVFFAFTFAAIRKLNLNPFYFFAIVAPYHLVMSGMNYTRQAVALSIFLYSISCLIRKEKIKFFIFIVLASLFHKSALCFLPLIIIDCKKRYTILAFIILVPPVLLSMITEYAQYFSGSMDSKGMYLRAIYLLLPTLLIVLHYKDIKKLTILEGRLCLLVTLSFPFVIVLSTFSTTIADRFAYYFILLNIMMWMIVRYKSQRVLPKHLKYYGNFILFLSSLFAFIVWSNFTNYIDNYNFDSYFRLWVLE